jgi:hypothetical protein
MSTDTLTQAFKDALAAMEAAQVPDDLRETAFVRALDHLLGGATVAPPAGYVEARDESPVGRVADGGTAAVGGDDAIGRIARRLHVDRAVAGRVFDVDDEGVHLLVPRSRFDAAAKTATQEVATLIVASRQAAGIDEEWTTVSEIKRHAEQKGVLDPGNFSRAIQPLDGNGMRIRGNPRSREIKMNDAGFEAAGQLVLRVAAEAS